MAYTANSWNTGFTADIAITNRGTAPINGWTLQWTWSGNQQVTNAWNATMTQNGSQVTARDAAWNATINPNTTTNFGLQASHSGSNSATTRFVLNGSTCTT